MRTSTLLIYRYLQISIASTPSPNLLSLMCNEHQLCLQPSSISLSNFPIFVCISLGLIFDTPFLQIFHGLSAFRSRSHLLDFYPSLYSHRFHFLSLSHLPAFQQCSLPFQPRNRRSQSTPIILIIFLSNKHRQRFSKSNLHSSMPHTTYYKTTLYQASLTIPISTSVK